MTQAVEDGATRPLYYESRVIRLNLDEDTLRLIDAEYEAMAENTAPASSKKAKGNWDSLRRFWEPTRLLPPWWTIFCIIMNIKGRRSGRGLCGHCRRAQAGHERLHRAGQEELRRS